MTRRVLAAEWLLFWFCVLLGLTVVPAALAALVADPSSAGGGVGGYLAQYYRAVFGAVFGQARGYRLLMLTLVLSPYLLFQWVRSIVWAVATLRGRL